MLIPCSKCGVQWDTEIPFLGAFFEGRPLCLDCIADPTYQSRSWPLIPIVDPMRGKMSVATWLESARAER